MSEAEMLTKWKEDKSKCPKCGSDGIHIIPLPQRDNYRVDTIGEINNIGIWCEICKIELNVGDDE